MSSSFEIKEQNTSWFYFPRAKRNLLNIDYKSVYAQSNWRIMRYILMRHTVLPNGRFLKNWEIFRAICAVMMASIQPANTIFQYYMPWINYVLWFLYIVGFSDIYIRLHGCYYNQKGILVTHPLYTAKYYLTHAFMIDIIALMPFHLIMSMLGNVDKPKLIMVLKFNVLLQLYRFSDAFSHKKKNSYRIETVLSRALRWAPLTFIIFNGFTCAGMIISGDVITKNGITYLIKKNFSFCNMNRKFAQFDIDELYNFYLISVYWTVISAFSLGFTQFHPVTIAELIFKIAAVVTGYIFVMHNTVFIAHSRFVVNQKLTMYQNYMKQLLIYMKMENIPKPLQTKTINHFEHMWRMTNGVQSNTITDMFHLPLKSDFVLQLYEETLNSVPGFTEDNKAFFRIIGMSVEETYLRRNASIISLNDIVDTIYIVHKGEVTVYGPANTYFAVLGIGSMFGNIDDVQYTRSMISVVTNSTTDLLKIHTNLFYKIVQNFPIIKARMERHILLENLSYMKSKAIRSQYSLPELGDTHQNIHPLLVFFSKRYFYIVMVFVSFVSCWLASYQAAFANSTILLYFLYFFDALHIAKVCISLYTPFYNKRGDLITDKRQIRKRYMVLTKFYFDCLTIFPYEVISLLAEPMQRESYRTTIGAYRVLRAFNIYQFFDIHENKLNSSALSVRIGATLTYCMVFIHLCACVAYGYSCPGHQCNKDGWTYCYSNNTKQYINRCSDPYLCSTYYVLSIFTSTGFNGHHPRTRLDLMFCIFIVILSKYIIAVLIGDLTALIRNYSYSLSQYNFELQIFNLRMRNSFVSGPFYEKLIRYFHNLWVARMGRQVPVLLLEAPHFLVEEINLAAYGHHIYDNLVFARCHKDFLRTLTRMLKVRTFFVGDTICYQEDVNNTMYFIHKGIVDVYSIYEHQEIHVDQLQDLDCFGMVQGLYPQTPHTHTYKSNAVTIVLLLKFEDWHILLKFFPASKFEIYKNMKILDKL